MPKFKVNVKEVHILSFEVEAANEEDAKVLVNHSLANDDISGVPSEYSHTYPMKDWTVIKKK